MGESYLTQAEIEALLGQVIPGAEGASLSRDRGHESVPGKVLPGGEYFSDAESRPRTSPSTAERKRLNRLWAIHERAAHNAGVALSAMLRAAVEVRLMEIETMLCHALATSMETPTGIGLLRSPSVAGQFVLEMPAAILLPMLDRMLGGSVQAAASVTPRPLSEIEQRLAMRLAGCVAGELDRAWVGTYALTLTVDRIETDARWLSIGPPGSDVVVALFDVRLGNARGTLRFGIPPQAMDLLERYLLADGQPPRVGSPPWMANPPEAAENQAELTVELASSATSAEEISDLSAGDLIATEHRLDSPVIVSLDGQPKFLGRLGAAAGRKAVRIIESTESAE